MEVALEGIKFLQFGKSENWSPVKLCLIQLTTKPDLAVKTPACQTIPLCFEPYPPLLLRILFKGLNEVYDMPLITLEGWTLKWNLKISLFKEYNNRNWVWPAVQFWP